MKTTARTICITSVIIFLSLTVSAQNTAHDLSKSKIHKTITEQSGLIKEEVPAAVVPYEFIEHLAKTYNQPNFEKVYQLLQSDKVVGFEVEFTAENKYKIVQFDIKDDGTSK
jgi:hypothetical protein